MHPMPASHSLFYTEQVKNSPFLAFGHQEGKEKKKSEGMELKITSKG